MILVSVRVFRVFQLVLSNMLDVSTSFAPVSRPCCFSHTFLWFSEPRLRELYFGILATCLVAPLSIHQLFSSLSVVITSLRIQTFGRFGHPCLYHFARFLTQLSQRLFFTWFVSNEWVFQNKARIHESNLLKNEGKKGEHGILLCQRKATSDEDFNASSPPSMKVFEIDPVHDLSADLLPSNGKHLAHWNRLSNVNRAYIITISNRWCKIEIRRTNRKMKNVFARATDAEGGRVRIQ